MWVLLLSSIAVHVNGDGHTTADTMLFRARKAYTEMLGIPTDQSSREKIDAEYKYNQTVLRMSKTLQDDLGKREGVAPQVVPGIKSLLDR